MKNATDFSHYHFDGQKAQEKILMVIHRHWFDILSQFILVFLMLFALLGSYFYFPLLFPVFKNPLFHSLFSLLESLFFLLAWVIFFLIWIDYYFDVWIVTDQRIINIEQKGLFARIVSELELEKIQDITTDVKGIIPTFLNYGNLYVQTAGEMERFVFRNIPNPYSIKDLIMALQKKYEAKEDQEFGKLISKKIHREDFT